MTSSRIAWQLMGLAIQLLVIAGSVVFLTELESSIVLLHAGGAADVYVHDGADIRSLSSKNAPDNTERSEEHGSEQTNHDQQVQVADDLRESTGRLEKHSLEHHDEEAHAADAAEDADHLGAHDHEQAKHEHEARAAEAQEMRKEIRELYVWPWQTWVCVIPLILCCFALQCLCFCNCCIDVLSSMESYCLGRDHTRLAVEPTLSDHARQNREMGECVRYEMRLALLYPLLPILAAPWTTCDDGSPYWLYAAFAPVLLRVKWREWQMLQRLREASLRALLSIAFIFGTLDIADWFLDGCFPVQAYACDAITTQPFALSVAQSKLWPFAPLVARMHFWGIAYVLLLAATLCQHAAAVEDSRPSSTPPTVSIAIAADVAGLGTVASHYAGRFVEAKRQTVFTRVFVENCLQMNIQATFFALLFEQLSEAGKLKLVASLVFGVLGALHKIATLSVLVWSEFKEAIQANYQYMEEHPNPSNSLRVYVRAFGYVILYLPSTICPLLFSAWTVAKVYFAFECESHIWNLSTLSCAQLPTRP